MKYKNAKDIFPDEILREIMKYVDGQYIYIPKKKENNDKVITEYRQEIDIRNSKIYEHYLIGMKYSEIAKMYCLSEKSVRRIVLNEKKKMEQKQVNVQQVMTKYGIEGDIKQIYSTAWNIGDEFVLKKYVNFEELTRNVEVLSILYSEQIPVPKIIATPNNEKYLKDEENKVDETQWFQYLKNLVKGYASVIPISIIERKSIPLVMECIELLFVAYFIGEKDERAMRDSLKLYEFCKDNCNKIKRSVQL